MNQELAAAALLQLIADNREAKCRALRERAASEVRAILKQAHAGAREQVLAALEEARKRDSEQRARAEAQRRRRERLAREQNLKARLNEGARRVKELLARWWQDPAERWTWAERGALRAVEVLPTGRWEIAHPGEWPKAERERLRQLLLERGVVMADFVPDPAIAAGVRLSSGNAVFDATLGGLLADRTAVEARLLFHVEDLRP